MCANVSLSTRKWSYSSIPLIASAPAISIKTSLHARNSSKLGTCKLHPQVTQGCTSILYLRAQLCRSTPGGACLRKNERRREIYGWFQHISRNLFNHLERQLAT